MVASKQVVLVQVDNERPFHFAEILYRFFLIWIKNEGDEQFLDEDFFFFSLKSLCFLGDTN